MALGGCPMAALALVVAIAPWLWITREIKLRSEPTNWWNNSAKACPESLGEANMTGKIRTLDKTP